MLEFEWICVGKQLGISNGDGSRIVVLTFTPHTEKLQALGMTTILPVDYEHGFEVGKKYSLKLGDAQVPAQANPKPKTK